jgi:gas vesicle protein
MFDRLIKSALLFTAGAAVGAAGAMWLMSDSGKEVRGKLNSLAEQTKEKIQECCEKVKQEMEANDGQADE